MTFHLNKTFWVMLAIGLAILIHLPGAEAQGRFSHPGKTLSPVFPGRDVDISSGLDPRLRKDRFFPSLLGLGRPGFKSVRTDHFTIYYGDAKRTARLVAEVAEEVFESIAPLYPSYFKSYRRVHVEIRDDLDFGNGYASFNLNLIVLWAAHLETERRGTRDWIKGVFTHEFTHIVTMKAARRGFPFNVAITQVAELNKNPDYIASIPLRDIALPTWFVEGIAQYEDENSGTESWDTHRDMLLRMATLEDDLLSYTEMGVFSRSQHHFEMAYNQGYSFLRYIDEVYGSDKVRALAENAGIVNFKSALSKVLGKSADEIYRDWKARLQVDYEAVADSLEGIGLAEGDKVIDEGDFDYYPMYSPDGGRVAYLSNLKSDFQLTDLRVRDLATGKARTIAKRVGTRFSWSPDGKKIFFNRAPGGTNDIYSYDLDTEEERRLTLSLRAKDPAVSPDGKQIAFVRHKDGTHNLGLMNANGTKIRDLTRHNDGTQYYGPRWSPDGKRIAFSVFRGKDRDIAVIRADAEPVKKPRKSKADSSKTFPDSLAYADNAGFEAIIRTDADERDPCWLPDGSGLVFASDRTGIFNLYEYDLDSKQVKQITNVPGGAFCPSTSPSGDEILYGNFHAADYSVYRVGRSGARDVHGLSLLDRDYREVYTGEPIDKLYKVGGYGTRLTLQGIASSIVLGPTFIGNRFGLDQISGGLQVAAGDLLGSDQIYGGVTIGKNLRRSGDINSDITLAYQKRLTPVSGERKAYFPTFYTIFNRETINSVLDLGTVAIQRDTLQGTLRIDTDEGRFLIPDALEFLHLTIDETDRFKDVFNTFLTGVELPLSSKQALTLNYTYRKLYETMRATSTLFDSSRVFQRGVEITDSIKVLDPRFGRPEVLDDRNLYSSDSGPFFKSSNLGISWRYLNITPTVDAYINPAGRYVSLGYRRINATVGDSLAQATIDPQTGLPVPTSGDPSPDPFRFDDLKLGINEITFSWNEFIRLGGRSTLALQTFIGYKDQPVKGFQPDGGPFEGLFYYPLRYYLGGWGSLRGYPYFSLQGGKALFGRASLTFPLIQRIGKELPPFYFDRLYATVYLETGATSDAQKLTDLNFNKKSFLSNFGIELRMQMFSFYRMPMIGFFQFAMPLFTRDVRDRNFPDETDRVDRHRILFGFSI